MNFVKQGSGSLLNSMGIPVGMSEEETRVWRLLSNKGEPVQYGDQRLNQIAALTYSAQSCQRIFSMLERALTPEENDWNAILHAVLILRVCACFGSEDAVDKVINLSHYVYKLQNYNSALHKKTGLIFTGSGGQDFGGPVREQATALFAILKSDETIRAARQKARDVKDDGNTTGLGNLVPIGHVEEDNGVKQQPALSFGQGVTGSVGAGFDLNAVPGMYEGRPERFFDDPHDSRAGVQRTGDAQMTRDAMYGSSLLDLPNDPVDSGEQDTSNNLPDAAYLPALERQRELEAKVNAQQQQLQEMQRLQSMAPQMPRQPQMGAMPGLSGNAGGGMTISGAVSANPLQELLSAPVSLGNVMTAPMGSYPANMGSMPMGAANMGAANMGAANMGAANMGVANMGGTSSGMSAIGGMSGMALSSGSEAIIPAVGGAIPQSQVWVQGNTDLLGMSSALPPSVSGNGVLAPNRSSTTHAVSPATMHPDPGVFPNNTNTTPASMMQQPGGGGGMAAMHPPLPGTLPEDDLPAMPPPPPPGV